MTRSSILLRWAWLPAMLLAACQQPGDAAAAIGDPLPGMTPAELARFHAGEQLFNRVFTPEDGLGPFFNENQCSACHTSPRAGGTGDQLLLRATVFTTPNGCDLLSEHGGENVRTQATPLLRARGIDRQAFPAHATERGAFTATFLFGLGLVELVPEEEILRYADPDDSDGDGISGRPGRDPGGRLGRFGRKADVRTLADFIDTALFHEMGLTTTRRPSEARVHGVDFTDADPAADPEVSDDIVALLTDFVRFLAPPRPRPPTDTAEQHMIDLGRRLFTTVGCADCHVPAMTTARHESAALSRRTVYLYSDLLLHDMGTGLANVCTPDVSPTELRTAPLLGLRHRTLLLHDGRAFTPMEAITLHGGEAAATVARFLALNETQRHALLAFLSTL